MWKSILLVLLSSILLLGTCTAGFAAETVKSTAAVQRHRAHKKTAKRVGVGAAGGAVIGALAGGGKGAAIGAVAGGGAGYVYDKHKKHQARRRVRRSAYR